MLIDVLVGVTNLERQSAALFLAPETIQRRCCMWQVPDTIY